MLLRLEVPPLDEPGNRSKLESMPPSGVRASAGAFHLWRQQASCHVSVMSQSVAASAAGC